MTYIDPAVEVKVVVWFRVLYDLTVGAVARQPAQVVADVRREREKDESGEQEGKQCGDLKERTLAWVEALRIYFFPFAFYL